ncbi:hypothetical protein [Streptacidiphilus monticola]|uniref:PucR family transcriptional regulator n=1 Tax=Streptacidiphilus monticola TaxID=2161674 RepID=A0ABW1FZN0_9ACTN
MDASQVTLLRELLADTPWVERADGLAGALRRSVTRSGAAGPGGLLLVGTEHEDPWHLAAHLDDESRWADLPELAPVLVRHRVPEGAPPHLAVPLSRLERTRRGETVFVVADAPAGEGLLQRVHDARRTGATVLALDGGAAGLAEVAHECLTLDQSAPAGQPPSPTFELTQHLVSAAAGAAPRRGLRAVLARIGRQLAQPPALRW